jgi:drug/metabolite transporter (DMT)-like permease
MLSAALIFAVLDGLIKSLGPAFRVWDIAFIRWGGSLALLIIIFGRKGTLFKTDNPKLMAIRSVTGCITFFLLIAAIRLIPLSTAMVLFFTFPAFAALFSALMFGERISTLQIFCITGTLIGVTVLLDLEITRNLTGAACALLSGIFAGFTVCLIKKLRGNHGPVVIYLYFCLLGALVSFPMFIAHPVIPNSGPEWLMAAGIACSAVMGQLLMNQGFKYCKSWEGGMYLTAEVVFTAILGIVFLGELTSWHFWTGGTLILLSVISLQLITARQTSGA